MQCSTEQTEQILKIFPECGRKYTTASNYPGETRVGQEQLPKKAHLDPLKVLCAKFENK